MTGAIALTFDDGPCPAGTPAVLTALAEADVAATFFVMGTAVRAHPELLDAALAAGHAVQLHCDEHVRHDRFAHQDDLQADVERALATLTSAGAAPTQWRVPWGVVGPWTKAVADQHGLQLVGWSADTEDWAGAPAEVLLEEVRDELRPGAVVLAHDGCGPGARRTDCAQTARWVGLVAGEVRARGLHFGPVGPDVTADRPAFRRPVSEGAPA